LAGGPIRPPAVSHGRPRASSRGRYRHARRQPCCPGGQSRHGDHPDRVRRRRRPGQVGLVTSLARPGGNATGINFFAQETTAKRLGLLHDLVPRGVRVAVLVNPANAATAEATLRDIPGAARALGLQLQFLNASTSHEIEAAFANVVRERADALFVTGDAFFGSRRVQFATLASRHGIPAAYGARDFVEVGGLMSYATDSRDMFRQVGAYTGQILKGAKPAELPVLQSTKFEFVINLQTARALGLELPNALLIAADEVIE
jgi:putative tryptophan/tyrosine transport system substrate-binding protein